MSTALATIDASELETMQRTAKMMMASGFFGGRGEEGIAQIAVKIMAGREMGYGPFASVRGIHVIQGTPALSANLMAAAVKGSPKYDYRVRQMDDAASAVEFFEIVNGQRESLGVSTFTQADAKRANTKNMNAYPRNMLFARAMSNGVRWFCPDVFSGMAVYVPEELGAEVDEETGEILQGNYKVVQPERKPEPILTGASPRQVAGFADNTDEALDLPDRMEDYGPPLDYDNPFTGNGLSKAAAGFLDKCRIYHAESDGPCTEAMYRYLVGTVNYATEKDAHTAILSEMVGSLVDSENRPGYTLTKKLLDTLPATKQNKETKENEPNPEHVPAILAAVKEIWKATKAA